MSQARNLDFQLFFGSCAFPIWSLGRVAEGGERQREAEGGEERGAPPAFHLGFGPRWAPPGWGGRGEGRCVLPTRCGTHCLGREGRCPSLPAYVFYLFLASVQDASPQERPTLDHTGAGRAKEEASSPAPEQ